MLRKRKYYLDLQVHTGRYSPCSRIPPERMIAVAHSRGLDGIAVTEHFGGWVPEELAELKHASGYHDFPLLAGYEIRTQSGERPTGDLIVFGVAQRPAEPCSIDQLCREVHRQGGIVVAPHPFAGVQGIGDEVYSSWVDAIEVYNLRYGDPDQSRRAEEACRQMNLAGLGASDAHALEEIGGCCTEFDDPIANERELMAAIVSRRCRPRPKPPPRHLWRLFSSR